MTEKLEEIRKRAEIAIREAKTLQDLDDVEICYLGRKGELTGMLRQLSSLPDEEKKIPRIQSE